MKSESADEITEEPQYDKGEEDEDREVESLEDVEADKEDTTASDDVKIEYDEALQKLVDGMELTFCFTCKDTISLH